ncbi:MAG TPA: PaeR7I family type II restriction endonuclease [Dehalococcoidia bacterium]|nr:PaeR7I family type II restriction endonuclease [Dehalococcoidia bacterium]
MFLVPSNVFTDAVRTFWGTRTAQSGAQIARGATDQGKRGSVTGGAHLHGFARTIITLLVNIGVRPEHIFAARGSLPEDVAVRSTMSLPGFYRATKNWDLLVVVDGNLVAALELKSQVGPSFGNNFNNRSEEAIGTAADIWVAYREGTFGSSPTPWLGYVFLLEDCEASRRPILTISPHFAILPEFAGASYARRYELLCRKLVRERQYSAACFLISDPTRADAEPNYLEPAPDLSGERFLTQLLAHVSGSVRP